MAKRKKKTPPKTEERGVEEVLDDLLRLGWQELKEKTAAEGKPMRVEPPSRYA